jgi:hypothetical protein
MLAIEFTGRSPTRQGKVDWGGELRFVRCSVSQNALFIMYNHGQSALQNSSFIWYTFIFYRFGRFLYVLVCYYYTILPIPTILLLYAFIFYYKNY